jgi:protocatechuate 3,4-dioxygenase beta subunit
MTELDRTLSATVRRAPMHPTYEGRPLAHPDESIFDQGLRFDLETELSRRSVLKLAGLGGLGAGLLAACGPAGSTASPNSSPGGVASGAAGGAATSAPTAARSVAPSAAGGSSTDCDVIPEETGGPFPGDGSNGPNVLIESGVIRRDITKSFGEFSGTAEGVPLTIRLIVQDAGNNCAPIDGAAVYAWHCTRDGDYSLYSDGVTQENFLRGVQEADADGVVEFASIFPGCYPGRWPHVHFEVYPSLETAVDEANRIATSQLALPEDVSAAVYASPGYAASARPFQQTSLARDSVFRDDGGVHQLGVASGDVSRGFVVELTVPVRA